MDTQVKATGLYYEIVQTRGAFDCQAAVKGALIRFRQLRPDLVPDQITLNQSFDENKVSVVEEAVATAWPEVFGETHVAPLMRDKQTPVIDIGVWKLSPDHAPQT